jgi:hypothetical protein
VILVEVHGLERFLVFHGQAAGRCEHSPERKLLMKQRRLAKLKPLKKGQSGNPKNLTEKWRGERRKEDDEEDSIFHLDSYLACRLCPDRKIIEA